MRRYGPKRSCILSLLGLLSLGGCAAESTTSAITAGCGELTGTPWVPSISGVSSANHDAGVTTTSTTLATVTGPVTGLAQGWNGREISVSIDMTADLGTYGSLTLLAQPVGFPSSLYGNAYPMLVSLSDGTHELINLARSNSGGDCAQSGAYTCTATSCEANAACSITWPSAYFDRTHWNQHQVEGTFGSYATTNTFPTCNWAGGNVPPSTDSACAFDSTFFVGGKLVYGVTYTAKYVLLADSYSSIGSSATAGVSVQVIKKTKTSNAAAGAIDVNVVLVGCDVAQASRTDKGKINLDSLFAAVQGFYEQANVNVKFGTVQAYEWQDGEAYADLNTLDLGAMVQSAGAALPTATEGKAVNIYLVNTVSNNSSLLGVSGGIGGPPSNLFANSGVVLPTFAKLDKFNPDCTASPCGDTQIEYDFADMEQTIAHEMGHYLGLNHPSEYDGSQHDVVQDTPICTATDSSAGNVLTISSCWNNDLNVYPATSKTCKQGCAAHSSSTDVYCPAALECEFNYLMYWSSKYFSVGLGTGDGNLFSPQSGAIINFHPLVQ
jgi:hypothetical protein